jgi:hypothetical protein
VAGRPPLPVGNLHGPGPRHRPPGCVRHDRHPDGNRYEGEIADGKLTFQGVTPSPALPRRSPAWLIKQRYVVLTRGGAVHDFRSYLNR